MRKLKEHGLEKVYLHLDGWGNPGYDNQHPDYLPACEEAGGWEGMRSLSKCMKEMNYIFAIHDQYRDYYFDAKTYDPEFSMISPEGKKPDFLPLGRRMADIHLRKPVSTLLEKKLYRTFSSRNSAGRNVSGCFYLQRAG